MSRIENEIEHGRKLHSNGAESIWNWSSAAGKKRADRRSEYFVELADVKHGDRVLEVGCGTGLFTRKFYQGTRASITAVDISQELLDEAKTHLQEVNFQCDDAMKLSFANNSFDVVFGSSILHHLDFRPAAKEIYRVMRAGGRMIFAEPNMLNPQIFVQKNVAFVKRHLGDSPDETAIVRWRFAKMMREIGFRKIRTFPYDFLHPSTPESLIPFVECLGMAIEKIPVVREIAGSVILYGEK